jgi:outer membrane protein OmpA-like peptidoglycan-associated protein
MISEDSLEDEEKSKPDGTNGSAAPIEEIRRLLLSPEQTQIRRLQERAEDPKVNAEMVSRVLPEAATLRSQRDNKLTTSLLPTVEDAITDSVKRRPEVLAGAIFPLMGPAIRKAIAAALSAMVISLNQALEESVSPRSLKWRMESWRTGKPFAEIVLLRTLAYRVEQVYLIHRRNGLLLQHVGATTLAAPGPDMISAMLTAIQDFVHDSFRVETKEDLDALQVGEFKVWIERGPQAVLAAVIRGEAPADLRILLQETLETIHRENATELADFEGDSAPFEHCRESLEGCLVSRFQEKKSSGLRAVGLAAGAAILVAAAFLISPLVRRHHWRNYVESLKAQPGIVVIEVDTHQGKYHIVGLRDPLAADPSALLRDAHLEAQDVEARWETFSSSYPAFALARAKELLAPPTGVSLKVDDGILYAYGAAPQGWIDQARKQFHFVGGIRQYDDTQIVSGNTVALRRAAQDLESESVDFLPGRVQLGEGEAEKFSKIVVKIRLVLSLAEQANQEVQITILGHADRTGDEQANERLSQFRANAVLHRLESTGLARGRFLTRGMGSRMETESGSSGSVIGASRAVSFHVEMHGN